ncbi:MAG: phage tail sheath subtilisin-like domain-containing protein [Paludibacteraceae bacterium]|nr:phage tail sheath subtilisin-like domain-containing protein [Paludibacteraceae bacterium]
MGQMKTPGVYIVEKNAFPNSVVQVPTAVPVFIGHTSTAENGGKSLLNKPWKITSMAEYINYFGGGPKPEFSITENAPATPPAKDGAADAANATPAPAASTKFSIDNYKIAQSNSNYNLYYSILLFYQNGGGPCYIVSIGDYKTDYDPAKFSNGIDLLIKEQEPTIIVMPELINLGFDDCIKIQQQALMHCGNVMQNRVAILDVYNGSKDRQDPDAGDVINKFREAIGINYLDFSAAYYPWLNTSIVEDSSLSFLNFSPSVDVLKTILTNELVAPVDAQLALLDKDKDKDSIARLTELKTQYTALLAEIKTDYDLSDGVSYSNFNNVNKSIIKISPIFNMLLKEIKLQINLLPPSAAMAGIYTMVDNSKGVWKAPANVSLNGVVSPSVNITHYDQEDLNVPLSGKSINAIRSFIGEGVLVWGARTLDGNSLDWRYISVRRTLIMLEQSIKIASKAYVFEPNVANTWITIKSMVRNFLTGIWKQGGLAGAVPDDAFSVHVGLGETMTADDILEGIMRITVLVAVSRPAEFIEITFQQQMQKS